MHTTAAPRSQNIAEFSPVFGTLSYSEEVLFCVACAGAVVCVGCSVAAGAASVATAGAEVL